MSEIEELIEEQQRDDTHRVKPEFRSQVPLTNGVANHIGIDQEGEIVTYWPRPPKGTLLVGHAAWHGTTGGYRNHGCRCNPCTEAQSKAVREYRKSRKSR